MTLVMSKESGALEPLTCSHTPLRIDKGIGMYIHYRQCRHKLNAER